MKYKVDKHYTSGPLQGIKLGALLDNPFEVGKEYETETGSRFIVTHCEPFDFETIGDLVDTLRSDRGPV